MSGGMEDAAKEARIREQEEKEKKATDIYYRQKFALEIIGVAVINLLKLVDRYEEIK